MKELHEFATLTDAQAYTDVTTKMISSDQMRIFMIQTGLYGYFKNHTSDAQMAAYDNMFGGEFNFINGHPSNVTPLFQLIISEAETPDKDAELTSLLNACIAFANKVTFPYIAVTQEEFDAAKAKQSLYVETLQRNTGYPIIGSTQEWYVQPKHEKAGVFVFLDEAMPVDATFDVYVDQYVNDVFVESPLKRLTITVKAGELSSHQELTRNYGRFKVRVVCNVSAEFDVVVKAA